MTLTPDERERRRQVGTALRQMRVEARVTIRALAEIIGVDHSHLSRVELGRAPASPRIRQAYEQHLRSDSQAAVPVSGYYQGPRRYRSLMIDQQIVIELDEWADPQLITRDLNLVAQRDGLQSYSTALVDSDQRSNPPEVAGGTIEYRDTKYTDRFKEVIRFDRALNKGDHHHVRLIETHFPEFKRADLFGGSGVTTFKRAAFIVHVPPQAADSIAVFRIDRHVPYMPIEDRSLDERLPFSPAGQASTEYRNFDATYGYGVFWMHERDVFSPQSANPRQARGWS